MISLVAVLSTGRLQAQSVMERSPNLGGTWLAEPGVVHFNLLHRFSRSAAPQRKISNSPTFVVAVRAPLRTMIGVAYATNSDVVQGIPNEWEVFGRFVPTTGDGSFGRLGVQVGYNLATLSVDGELAWSRRIGPARLMATSRAFSNAFDAGLARFAVGGGGVIQLRSWLGVAGDAVTLVSRRAGERIGWSTGVQLGVPATPHTLSVHATNTNSTTLEGLSNGTTKVRYGFEYTIPVHLARFRRPRVPAGSAPSATIADPVEPRSGSAPDTVRITIRNLAYAEQRIELARGTVVVWVNEDPLVHTVTADDGTFDSGNIQPATKWTHRFSKPGSYAIHCTPHPFMRAVVVVR